MFAQPLIALWRVHPGDLLGEPIQFLTHGPITHAGWLRSDGKTIWEAYVPKIRCRPLADVEKAGIELFSLVGMTPTLATRFERYFDITTDGISTEEYSIKGLFGYALNIVPADEQHVFCSEAVMQSVRKLAPDLLPLKRCDDYKVDPVDLYRSAVLNPEIWPV